MDNLQINNSTFREPKMTSLKIAGLTNKEHKNVLADIRAMMPEMQLLEKAELRFQLSFYDTKYRKNLPIFELNEDQTLLLASGYNSIIRALLIKDWRVMKSRDDYSMVARTMTSSQLELLTSEVKEKEQVLHQLDLSKPKVEYYDNVLRSSTTYSITQLAKELNFKSARALNSKLHEIGIQYNQAGNWHLFSKYSNKGYVVTETFCKKSYDGYRTQTINRFTEKGRAWLHHIFNNQLLLF